MTSKRDIVRVDEGFELPQNMPDHLLTVEENIRWRPYYCYWVFLNNVDNYLSRELAKTFHREPFLTPEVIESLKDPTPPLQEESEVDEEEEEGIPGVEAKSTKSSKRKSKSGSRKSKTGSGKSKTGSRKSKTAARKSKAAARKSKTASRKSKTASKGSSRRSSKQRKSTSSKNSSKKSTKKKSKTKQSEGTVDTVIDLEEAEKRLEELWPKFRKEETLFKKAYDWNEDYHFLEDLRLLSHERIGFDIEKAKKFHDEPVEWDEDRSRRMKDREWMYSHCERPCGSLEELSSPCFQLDYSKVTTVRGPGGDTVPSQDEPALHDPHKLPSPPQAMKPNVTVMVKEVRNKLWTESRGKEVLNFYNNDLFNGNPTHRVVATRTTPLPDGEQASPEIFKTIANIQSKENYQSNMFPCLIHIYDITKSPNCIVEARNALDWLIEELLSCDETLRLRNQASYGIHTFILISPLLTWAETRTLAKQPQDCLREEYFHKRIPHPLYKEHWEFENYVYEKAYEYRDLLKIIIIGVGLVYGNGDEDLKQYYEVARRSVGPVLFLGRGYNIVPLIHVEDLAKLCLDLTRHWPKFTRYIIAAERKFRTCREIMEIIANEIGEGNLEGVPCCFGQAVEIHGEKAHNLLYNEFKFNCTYLHDIRPFEFVHDFGTDIKKTFAQYEISQGYKPLRIVLFGPSDADQRKVGQELADRYGIPYINGFRAVKIFLRILLDIQKLVLDGASGGEPPDKWMVVGTKSEFFQFNKSAPLDWHRDTRLLFHRDPQLEPLRDLSQNQARADPLSVRVTDILKPNFLDKQKLTQADPNNPKYKSGKELLFRLERLREAEPGTGLLDTLTRVDVEALIVHEILNYPTCRNNGYVLDGLPSTEEEAEIIFSKEGVYSPGAQRRVEDYQHLPTHIFHIRKTDTEAMRDWTKGENALPFQKEYVGHFRRMQILRLIMTRNRTALDFFEDKFKMRAICFNSGVKPWETIVQQIAELINGVDGKDPPEIHDFEEPNRRTEGTFTRNDDPQIEEDEITVEKAELVGEEMIKEMALLPDKALRLVHYLNKFVSKSLIDSIIQSVEDSPVDFTDWMAFHLMANNDKGCCKKLSLV